MIIKSKYWSSSLLSTSKASCSRGAATLLQEFWFCASICRIFVGTSPFPLKPVGICSSQCALSSSYSPPAPIVSQPCLCVQPWLHDRGVGPPLAPLGPFHNSLPPSIPPVAPPGQPHNQLFPSCLPDRRDWTVQRPIQQDGRKVPYSGYASQAFCKKLKAPTEPCILASQRSSTASSFFNHCYKKLINKLTNKHTQEATCVLYAFHYFLLVSPFQTEDATDSVVLSHDHVFLYTCLHILV